jgi:hypothetical protein
MAVALARHDELVEQVVTSRGGRLIKTRGEGDATFSVFDRPSAAAAAVIELQEAIRHEPWTLSEPMRIRVALHTGEVELCDGDYFAVRRHDWDAIAAHFAGATYVNHRQLALAGTSTIADWLSSMRTIGSLIPDFWVELAEVLARSAIGIVGRMALKGTSTDGVAIEIPYVLLILLDGDRVTRFEAFDEDQRDLALSRFQELSQA